MMINTSNYINSRPLIFVYVRIILLSKNEKQGEDDDVISQIKFSSLLP